jgi:membrane-bound lytic murein transglycosylase MltF
MTISTVSRSTSRTVPVCFRRLQRGARQIQSLRREAAAQNLDPNLWFNNVERMAAARVGQETVRYVRNIYKYYVAYKLIEEADAAMQPRRSRLR